MEQPLERYELLRNGKIDDIIATMESSGAGEGILFRIQPRKDIKTKLDMKEDGAICITFSDMED